MLSLKKKSFWKKIDGLPANIVKFITKCSKFYRIDYFQYLFLLEWDKNGHDLSKDLILLNPISITIQNISVMTKSMPLWPQIGPKLVIRAKKATFYPNSWYFCENEYLVMYYGLCWKIWVKKNCIFCKAWVQILWIKSSKSHLK